jgi:quercetin dioxygenase-like cupin family protein
MEAIDMPFVVKRKDLQWKQIREGLRRAVVTTDRTMVVIYEAQPGPGLGTHRHPDCEQIVYYAQGSADLIVGEEAFSVEAGDFVFFPAGVEHGGQLTGEQMAISIDIFSPPLEDYLEEAIRL